MTLQEIEDLNLVNLTKSSVLMMLILPQVLESEQETIHTQEDQEEMIVSTI